MKDQIITAGAVCSILTCGALLGGTLVWQQYQIQQVAANQASTVQEFNTRIFPEIQKKIDGVALSNTESLKKKN